MFNIREFKVKMEINVFGGKIIIGSLQIEKIKSHDQI